MLTDHLLVRRMAGELSRDLRGGRVRDAGLLDDGRFALAIHTRGKNRTLAIAPFANPPSITWVEAELGLADPSWTRAVAQVVRGLSVTAVRSRRGDRVLAIDLGVRSRFGVASEFRLIAELIPRFGNVVLLRDETIVAAAKTFSPAENPERSIEVGARYSPPPLPAQRLDAEGFRVALGAGVGGWLAALGAHMPFVPRLLAQSWTIEARALDGDAGVVASWFERRLATLEAATQGEPEGLGPVHAYRQSGKLVQAYVMALAQFSELEDRPEPALLPLLLEASATAQGAKVDDALERRRAALAKALRGRIVRLEGQLARIRTQRADIDGRDLLRRSGEALYTHLTDVPVGATTYVPPTDPELHITLDPTLDAKANAAALFARYRKAADALPHLERREAELDRERESAETLMWEVERADRDALDELDGDASTLLGAQSSRRAPGRKTRKISATELPSGARLYVGRSPRENVAITFDIARPDDLWFHARNTPGSHVVLQPAPGEEPADADVEHAASLAALHSRAKASPKVEVDYTRRKFVRKQRDAAPGLVWYTDFKTIVVAPAAP